MRDTQVETSYGMPDLRQCHCRRSQLALGVRALCRKSLRTTVLRNDSGIAVINHPWGISMRVDGGWGGLTQ